VTPNHRNAAHSWEICVSSAAVAAYGAEKWTAYFREVANARLEEAQRAGNPIEGQV
jgi:hypothetical protein